MSSSNVSNLETWSDKRGMRTRIGKLLTGRAGIVFCTCAIVAASSQRRGGSAALFMIVVWVTREEFRKKSHIPMTRDHVPRWWKSAQVLLLMAVVVHGSPRIHVRAIGHVAERQSTNARSYVPAVLIPALVVLGPHASQEVTVVVGRGRVSEWALSSSSSSLWLTSLLGLGFGRTAFVRWRGLRLEAC